MLLAPWVLAATAAVHLFADVSGTIDLSNRTEVRGRDTSPVGQGTPNPSLDLVDTASARLAMTNRRWAYNFDYSAMAMSLDAEQAITPQLLQTADASVAWHDRRVTLGFGEYAGFGQLDFGQTGPLVTTPTASTGTPLPPAGVQVVAPGLVEYGSSRSVLRAVDRLARRWTLTLSVEYAVQGGIDGQSQAVLPLVRGPRGDGLLAYALSRRDALETRVMVQRSDTSTGICSPFIVPGVLTNPAQPCDPQGQIGEVTEGWRRALSRTTTVSIGAGVSVAQVRFQDAQDGFDTVVFPTATASAQYLRRVEDNTRVVRFDFAAAPFVDLRTGLVDERAQALGTLEFPTHKVLYSGILGASRSIASPFLQPLTSLQATAEAEYRVSRVVGVGGGVRYFWQEQTGFPTFSLATIFAQITLRAPQQRF
jgi:hypothetical protein